MTGCKIGKIKMKSGGAEIRVFENKKFIESDETRLLEKVMHSARRGDITGVMVAWIRTDGSTGNGVSFGCFDDVAKSYGVASNMAAFVREELYDVKR